MLEGDMVRDGWRDEAVKKALDLCLACKGCKSDCPTSVDMATYKAEFLAHYYEGRKRPLHAYLFGNIDVWARLASHAPGLVNLATQTPGFNMLAKLAAGIPMERSIPALAPRTFQGWFSRRAVVNAGKPRVLLWPDTFNNYFTPETSQAAVNLLEDLGFQVVVPSSKACCGRPLYDFGMLERAKRLLQNVMSKLERALDEGIPLIVLEPSCASVFRDELCNLFPAVPRAGRLREQTYLLSEFLQKFAADADLPKLERAALVHGHCHQKAMKKMDSEEAVLRRIGVAATMPDNGCCGMAGPFGFNKEKYEVSLAVGESELLPRVRKALPETIVLADGFSCREQIAQTTDRHALHLAEVLQMAMRTDAAGLAGIPERRTVDQRKANVRRSMVRAAVALAGVAAAGFGLWLRRKS
jgi:Fe-S oxidoreductase